MPEHKYAMAKLDLLQNNPELDKAARKRSSAAPVNLEERRLRFEKKAGLLEEIIRRIQHFNADLHETHDPVKAAYLEREIATYSNLANLQGLLGLYEGFGLLADMLSLRMVQRDKTGQEVLTPAGDKIFIRVPVLYDIASEAENISDDTEEIKDQVRRMSKNIFTMALKQNAVYVGQAGSDPEVKEPAPKQPDQPEVLPGEAPAGVPESDLAAAQVKPSEEEVAKFIEGEKK